MNFNSPDFIVFLILVVATYWFLPLRGQNVLLLAASYLFYGYVHPWFLFLILGMTGANYLAALGMVRHPHLKKPIMLLAVAASFACLGIFKYLDFFLDNIALVLGMAGLAGPSHTLSIFLPVGISFYTFQVVGYTVDVYRGGIEARKDFLTFALFVSFFPQLVAGPIERAGNLLPQLEKPRRLEPEAIPTALVLIIWGFFKKLVVADNLSPIVDKIFAVQTPSFWLIWIGSLAFAFQILADFSAYTDIARGSARLLGIELVRNFNDPYLSRGIGDFWRRWHMSLSYWLRDYVYIPLGGNKKGPWRSDLNIMITFLASGLWHGAQWNFVLWGAYHGILVVLERWLARSGLTWKRPAALAVFFKTVFTFLLVVFGWMLFRETGGLDWIWRHMTMTPWNNPEQHPEIARFLFALVMLYSIPLWAQSAYQALEGALLFKAGRRAVLVCRVAVASILFVGILTLRSLQSGAFIYFQF